MVGMARWLRAAGQPEEALAMLRRGVDAGLSDELLFRTLWDIALLERKLGRESAAIAVWTELAAARNPFRARAIEELAKYYEHREKNPDIALDLTRQAMALEETPALQRRETRLRKRIAANSGKSGKIF